MIIPALLAAPASPILLLTQTGHFAAAAFLASVWGLRCGLVSFWTHVLGVPAKITFFFLAEARFQCLFWKSARDKFKIPTKSTFSHEFVRVAIILMAADAARLSVAPMMVGAVCVCANACVRWPRCAVLTALPARGTPPGVDRPPLPLSRPHDVSAHQGPDAGLIPKP